MARGGYRPGAGRPKLTEAEKAERRAKKAAGILPAVKRVSVKKAAPKKAKVLTVDCGEDRPTTDEVPADIMDEAKLAAMSPLDYMLAVMRTPAAEDARRDRMAIAAAPFVHARKEPVGQGKKEDAAARAKTAGAGKYGAIQAPKLAAANGRKV